MVACRIISFVIPHDEYCSDKAYRSRVQIYTKVALYPIGNFQCYTNWGRHIRVCWPLHHDRIFLRPRNLNSQHDYYTARTQTLSSKKKIGCNGVASSVTYYHSEKFSRPFRRRQQPSDWRSRKDQNSKKEIGWRKSDKHTKSMKCPVAPRIPAPVLTNWKMRYSNISIWFSGCRTAPHSDFRPLSGKERMKKNENTTHSCDVCSNCCSLRISCRTLEIHTSTVDPRCVRAYASSRLSPVRIPFGRPIGLFTINLKSKPMVKHETKKMWGKRSAGSVGYGGERLTSHL